MSAQPQQKSHLLIGLFRRTSYKSEGCTYCHLFQVSDGSLSFGSGFSGITLAINQESKADVDELYKRIIKNGGKPLVAPRNTFWGGYDCYFANPDGHVWEIAWAPFWKFDGQGSLVL